MEIITAPGLAASAVFVVAATFALISLGWMASSASPFLIQLDEAPPAYDLLSHRGRRALQWWMVSAGLIGLLLPMLALLIWHDDPVVCQAVLPYLAVLVVQLFTEWALIRHFYTAMGPLTGLVYTAFRIWQLWTLDRFFDARHNAGLSGVLVNGLLQLALVFWSANLLMLVFIVMPRLLSSARRSSNRKGQAHG